MRIRTLFAALVVTLGLTACGTELDEAELNAGLQGELGGDELAVSEDALGPNSAAPQYKSVQLYTGVKMNYRVQGNPNGMPVIFIPGYSDSIQTWSLNWQTLPAKWRVYMIDQRGHGDSSKPPSWYAQSNFGADLVAFMDAMGLQKVALVGHSMGSFVAHKVAATYPNRVSHLVLIGSATTAVGHVPGIELRDFMYSLTEVDPDFVEYFQRSTFYKPVPESYIQGMIAASMKVPLHVWQEAMAGLVAEDHTANLKYIKAKTLILFGDQDSLFNLQHQYDLKAAIPGSVLKVYPGVGHGLHAEIPQQFKQDLLKFLK